MAADWFERLTGFREEGYELTLSRLVVEGDELVSTVNGARYGVGELSLPTLAELRSRRDPQRSTQHRAVRYRGSSGDARRAGTRGRTLPGGLAVQPAGDDRAELAVYIAPTC